jgi:hypothetical protein
MMSRRIACALTVAVAVPLSGCSATDTSWDGELTFQIVEDPNDRSGQYPDPEYVDVTRVPDAAEPLRDVTNESVPREQVPPGSKIGDRLRCQVHQEFVPLTESADQATTTIGPCQAA